MRRPDPPRRALASVRPAPRILSALLFLCAGLWSCDAGVSCATAPLVTWENFGEGFVRSNCQACHASTAADRKEAPVEVAFDTEQETLSWTDRILERSTGENASMPPAGGVTDEDKYLLEVWLRCGAE